MKTDIEHASLRQEILMSGSHAINVANIVVTITGAALFAGFQFRNPYIVLFPLFALYYGHGILFNTSQTIARISVYLRLVEKERYESRMDKLRKVTRSDENDFRNKIPVPLRWLTPHTVLWEQWIAPILQGMFMALGFVCILSYWLIVSLVIARPNTAPNAQPNLILDPATNEIILAAVLLIWLWIANLARRNAHTLYGEGSMVEQFEKAWVKALETEDSENT